MIQRSLVDGIQPILLAKQHTCSEIVVHEANGDQEVVDAAWRVDLAGDYGVFDDIKHGLHTPLVGEDNQVGDNVWKV